MPKSNEQVFAGSFGADDLNGLPAWLLSRRLPGPSRLLKRQQLIESIGDIPPIESEQKYYTAQHNGPKDAHFNLVAPGNPGAVQSTEAMVNLFCTLLHGHKMFLDRDNEIKAVGSVLPAHLCNIVFRIGSPCGQNYGFLVLREGGEVFGYQSENEFLWSYDGDDLVFISSAGLISSRFNPVGDGQIWIGRHERRLYPMYLIPVLSYRPTCSAPHLPPAVINSIPKSGTHLCEKILHELGFESGATMFTWEDVVDDFQHEDGLELDDVEGSRGKICPLESAVGAIPNGTVVLAHSTSPSWVTGAFEAGVRHVHCVRNLRDILISLYRWKRRGTDHPHNLENFLEFLRSDGEADLALIERSGAVILSHGKERTVRFEDLVSPETAKRGAIVLARAFGLPLENVHAAVLRAQGTETTTYNTVPSDHHTFWDEDIEQFFEQRGLGELNRKLGYR